MKNYPYKTLSENRNAYGQQSVTSTTGYINMAINILTQNTKDYILYSDAEFIGLTNDNVDDTYIISYGEEELKVKYVNPIGRLTQVFMVRI